MYSTCTMWKCLVCNVGEKRMGASKLEPYKISCGQGDTWSSNTVNSGHQIHFGQSITLLSDQFGSPCTFFVALLLFQPLLITLLQRKVRPATFMVNYDDTYWVFQFWLLCLFWSTLVWHLLPFDFVVWFWPIFGCNDWVGRIFPFPLEIEGNDLDCNGQWNCSSILATPPSVLGPAANDNNVFSAVGHDQNLSRLQECCRSTKYVLREIHPDIDR